MPIFFSLNIFFVYKLYLQKGNISLLYKNNNETQNKTLVSRNNKENTDEERIYLDQYEIDIFNNIKKKLMTLNVI